MKIIYFIIIVGLSPAQTTFNFLDFPYNSRSIGLNNSGVASKSNYLSINPASIKIDKKQFVFNYILLPADINSSSFSFSELYKKNIFYLIIRNINYGILKDDMNNLEFKAYDLSIEFGHKIEYKKIISFGYSLGYVKSKIFNYNSSGLFFNCGLRFNLINDRLSFGSAFNHFGFQTDAFLSKNEFFPTTFRNGFSYKPLYLPAMLYLDYIKLLNEKKNKIQFGIEFTIKDKINCYFSIVNNKKELDIEEYYKDIFNKIGFGLDFKMKTINYNISFQNLGPLGLIYGFSILI